jgi:hypothetical protein
MLGKIVTAFILVPLAILIAAFAVANRGSVVISFDPFDLGQPAYTVAVPLFALILLLVLSGVIVGGTAAWLKQRKWRLRARRSAAEVDALRAEVDALRQSGGAAAPGRSRPTDRYAPRLIIPPPAA